MNTKQLKDSILQYAMQGKLFNDLSEDTARLYEDIKNFQEEQIEAKLLKRDKDDYSIDLDQIPFDIPENWKWVKIGDVFSVKGGKRVPRGYKLLTSETPYVYLRVADMKDGSITSYDLHYVDEEIYQGIKNYTISKDNLYLTIAGTIGKVGTIPKEFDGALLTENAVKIVINQVDKQFIKLLLESPIVQNQFQQAVNKVAQPKLSIRNINQVVIPLPPLSVQIELVHRIEELASKLRVYNESKTNLDLLNKSFPLNLEKSILQYAMQGKLVEQDTNDEPAQQLIEKIQLEKERLIKEKVIKKEKPLPPITEEEIPFDIPSSWGWVRLGSIINLISGRDLTSSEYGTNNKETPYITGASNFNNGTVEVTRWTPCPKVISKKGDILITCKGTVGELAIQNLKEAHIARQVMAIRLIHTLDKEFIQLCLKYKVTELKHAAKSMIPGISRADLLNLVIPLPPYEEQIRIVQAVENLSIVTNNLRNNN